MAGTQMKLEDWLDDLCVRFIINLPEEDLSSVARICFQVEEAQWFYEDFIRPLDPSLPSMSLRTFCLRIFQHCPLLAQFSVENHTQAFEQFLEYKTRIPVRGAILINHDMDSAVLVKGWKKGANWGFPGGKINKDEDDLECAIREVYEETGFDVRAAGLVPADGKVKYIELPIRNHQVRLYVFRDVPMDTDFQPRTRKEISKIQWYKFSELPTFRKKAGQNNEDNHAPGGTNANKFYMVAPFMVPLKKWVGSQKKMERKPADPNNYPYAHVPIEEAPTEEEGWTQPEMDGPRHHIPPMAPVPAIETLDGATQELQRLLKMQPPTQGLQPQQVPQQQTQPQDKGSALLSILQAKSSGPGPAGQQAAGMPHTPLDHLFAGASQPRNPHHHTNQQSGHVDMRQPPPSYQMSHGEPPQPRGIPQNRHQYPPLATAPPPPHQQYSANRAPLVHPQPLPPQVQRSMFNNSAFQDGQSTPQAHAQTNGHGPHPAPSHHAPQPHHARAPQSQGQPQGQPGQLNGQSMALLNAFKREDPAAAASSLTHAPVAARPADTAHAPHHGQQQPPYHASAAAAAHPNQHLMPQQHKSPMELAGSAVGPPANQHKNALLGMFKKRGSDATASPSAPAAVPAQVAPGPQQKAGNVSSPNNDLLSLFQRRPSQQDPKAQTLQQQQQQQQPRPAASPSSDMLMKHLSIQPQPNQPRNPSTDAPAVRQAQQQPVRRILQRGASQQSAASQPSPHTAPAQPSNLGHHLASPHANPAQTARSPSFSSQQQQHPTATNSRPSFSTANPEQKRQLLSLFGKQQQQQQQASSPGTAVVSPLANNQNQPMSRNASFFSATVPAPGAGENPAAAAAASPRRAPETPISPAEQTFLLDYLQSVTSR